MRDVKKDLYPGPKSKGLRTCGEQDRRRDDVVRGGDGNKFVQATIGLEKSGEVCGIGRAVAVAFLVSGNRSTVPKLISRDLPNFVPKGYLASTIAIHANCGSTGTYACFGAMVVILSRGTRMGRRKVTLI